MKESLKHLKTKIFYALLGVGVITFFCFEPTLAQQPYYLHTIHSHGLSFIGGRTAKINYMYQISRIRQLKISGTYIHDSFDMGRNHIVSNIYLVNAQFQYHLLHTNKFFLNCSMGGGGYNLTAKDRLNIKHKEWRFNFVGGIQAEFYVINNTFALTVDYDFLFLPWSKIYEFMHIPTAGITLFFF